MSRRAATPAPELPGYRYEKLLGSGGFSDVFLYEQKLPKRKVAVKVLLTDELDQQSRAHFVAEANVMAQLSAHPYIVTIYHADVSADDRPYFVMEYCSGPSLGDRYKRERFAVEDALRIGIRVASAVATAHAAGILHRDIKPANVLTNDFGWPALTDFGISSTLEDELPVHTTTLSRGNGQGSTDSTTKQSVGLSVPWSPPEMFEDDPKPDVRSDVFSLAATVYTLLAGRTPFEIPGRSNGTLDLIGRIERGAVTPLDRPDVPRTLIAVLAKGMARDRDDRFATAVDFARALQRIEMELGYAPTSIEVPNLAVAQPVQDAGPSDSADETRVRPVATVIAQPTPPRPPNPESTRLRPVQSVHAQQPPARSAPQPPVSYQPHVAEHTVLRSAPVVQPSAAPAADATIMRTPAREGRSSAAPAEGARPAQGARPPHGAGHGGAGAGTTPVDTGPDGEAVEQGGTRRVGVVVGILAAVVVVIGGIVTAVALAPHGTPAASHTDAPGSDDGQIDVSQVPDPKLVSAVRSADGTSVTFAWKNPKPKPEDSYIWLRDGTTSGPQEVAEPHVTITGLPKGQSVCIDVSVLRAGQQSPNPLKMCSP